MENNSLMITIITGVAILIIIGYSIYSLYEYYKNMYIINELALPADKLIFVNAGNKNETTIPVVGENQGIAYAISTWLYVNPTIMSKNANPMKNIMMRGTFSLDIDLARNKLILTIPIYGRKNQQIIYDNFPTQKWINILINVNNRRVDLWLNGKLYKARKFDNIVVNNQNSHLIMNSNGGFNGSIGRTYYYKSSLQRNQIIDIFDNGPYPTNFLSKLWDRTKIILFAKLADISKEFEQEKVVPAIPTRM
jgi:hypothetical protein